MSFITAAPAIAVYFKEGYSIFAWFIAILVSIIFSTITNSQELLTYRHISYAMEPISILLALGLVKWFDMAMHKTDTEYIITEKNPELTTQKFQFRSSLLTLFKPEKNKIKKSKFTSKKQIQKSFSIPSSKFIPIQPRIIAASAVLILLALCGVFSYPPLDVVSGFEEGTTYEELETCLWARDHLEASSTVASDHRMSSMMFGFANINSSWEHAPQTLHGESFSDAEDEISNASVPAGEKRLDYVLLTDSIRSGVALKQWKPAEPMSEPASKKFETKPFIKIFDNGEAQVYYIDS
jgi:hypothetical protein